MKPALLLYPHISSYPALLLVGFFFGWLLARSRARFLGILPRDLDNIGLLLPLSALFGARLFARLFYAKLPLLEALKVWEGDGLVFYGGFVFGVAAVVLYGLIRKIKLTPLMDCVAPSVALGLAFGRIGCFLAGCCWGDVCVDKEQLVAMKDPTALNRIHTIPAISQAGWPLAVRFPERSSIYKQHLRLGLVTEANSKPLPVHPVQLYEAALAAILCIFLCSRRKLLRRAGNVSLGLLIGYGLIRFGTEFLRADNKVYAFGLTFSQVVSVWILLGSTILISIRSLLAAKTSGEAASTGESQLAATGGSGNTNSI